MISPSKICLAPSNISLFDLILDIYKVEELLNDRLELILNSSEQKKVTHFVGVNHIPRLGVDK